MKETDRRSFVKIAGAWRRAESRHRPESPKFMRAAERVDYTSMEIGQTVNDRSGVIGVCPKCGLHGLKQTSGSTDVARYLHGTSPTRENSEETIQADFCYVILH